MTDKLPPQPFVRQKQQSAPLQEVIGRVPGEIQNVQLDSEGIEESCISKNQDQMKRPRLNLNHGFVRFIQRNQLDRDEYHKMHEQRKTELRKRLGKQVEEAVNGVTAYPSILQTEPIAEQPQTKSEKDEDFLRRQIRRRIERSQLDVASICEQLEEYSVQETERALKQQDETILFSFKLTLSNGDVKIIDVPKNVQPARLAKATSREHCFDDEQCRNLRFFVEAQMEKRLAMELKAIVNSPSKSPDVEVQTI